MGAAGVHGEPLGQQRVLLARYSGVMLEFPFHSTYLSGSVESWRLTLCSLGMVGSSPCGCWHCHGMPFPISSHVSAQLTSPWLWKGKNGLESSQLQSCRNHIALGFPGSQQLHSHQGTPLPQCPGTPMGPWTGGQSVRCPQHHRLPRSKEPEVSINGRGPPGWFLSFHFICMKINCAFVCTISP